MYTYNNFQDTMFIEYIKELQMVYEMLSFRLDNNSLIIRIKTSDLLDETSIIRTLLQKYPNKGFNFDSVSIENTYIDLSDEFACEYANLLRERKYLML